LLRGDVPGWFCPCWLGCSRGRWLAVITGRGLATAHISETSNQIRTGQYRALFHFPGCHETFKEKCIALVNRTYHVHNTYSGPVQ